MRGRGVVATCTALAVLLGACSSGGGPASGATQYRSLAALRPTLARLSVECDRPKDLPPDPLVPAEFAPIETMQCHTDGIDLSAARYAKDPKPLMARYLDCEFASDVTEVDGGLWQITSQAEGSLHGAYGTPAERKQIGRIHERIAKATGARNVVLVEGC